MKKIIFFFVIISVFFSCNLMKQKTIPAIFETKYNGFYAVSLSGVKIYNANDSTDFVYIDTTVLISVSDIKRIKKQKNKTFKVSELYIELTPEGKTKFADYTTNNVGEKIAIVFGNKFIAVPVVQEPIIGGELVITSYDDEFFDDIIKAFKQLN